MALVSNLPYLIAQTPLNNFCWRINCTEVVRVVAPMDSTKTLEGSLVHNIIEKNACNMAAVVDAIGDDDEKKKFRNLFDGPDKVVAPHHQYPYQIVDRNRADDKLNADPFNKMFDAKFTGFTRGVDRHAEFAFMLDMVLGSACDEFGFPLDIPAPDLSDNKLVIEAGRHNTGSGDFGHKVATTKHNSFPKDINTTINIINMLSAKIPVPIIPSNATVKMENVKATKGVRYIINEMAVVNVLSQIVVGPYIDSKISVPFNNSMNGVTPQYGNLTRITNRQLLRQIKLKLKDLELMLQANDGSVETTRKINQLIIAIVSDFKNFEFNHNPYAKIISRLPLFYYYNMDRNKTAAKLISLWLESHCLPHILISYDGVSDAFMLLPRPGTVLSGSLDTLFGNTTIQKIYHFMALCYVMDNFEEDENLDLYINWILLCIMQGDDFYSLANPKILNLIIEHLKYLTDVLYQHLKYEFTEFISETSPLGFNYNAGDFLKTCAKYDRDTQRIVFFKPTDQFLLRVFALNSPDVQAKKLLSSYGSMALQAGSNPFMYAMLRKFYDHALQRILDAQLIKPIVNARTRGLVTIMQTPKTIIDDNKREMKFAPDPLSMQEVSAMDFPTYDQVVIAMSDNGAVLSTMNKHDSTYAIYGINHNVLLEYSFPSQ